MIPQSVEICFIVTDSLKALTFYERIFDLLRLEVTDFPLGTNEVVFSIYGTQFHLLDENPEFQMFAPKAGDPKTVWYNVTVTNISKTHKNALEAGCLEIQPITKVETHGVKTAMFSDPFGYVWQLHEIVRDVAPEERNASFEQ